MSEKGQVKEPVTQITPKITLVEPLVRGETKIDSVTLRKPQAGELRGVSLSSLVQMEVDAIIKVVPRISTPMLTEAEVARLDPADLMDMASEVAGFLLSKQLQQA